MVDRVSYDAGLWEPFSENDVVDRGWDFPAAASVCICPSHPRESSGTVFWRKCSLINDQRWIADFKCWLCHDAGTPCDWTACVLCGLAGQRQCVVPKHLSSKWGKSVHRAAIKKHLEKASHLQRLLLVETRKLGVLPRSTSSQTQVPTRTFTVGQSNVNTNHVIHEANVDDQQNFDLLVHEPRNCFGNAKSKWYFTADEIPGGGARAIIVKSQSKADSDPADGAWQQEDIDLGFQTAEFVCNLSQDEQAMFAEISRLIRLQSVRNMTRISMFCKIPVHPEKASEIRNMITEGKSSMFENLPHPSWHVHDGIAYVSIRDAIQDFLAHGFEIDEIRPPDVEGVVRTPGESCFAQSILANAIQRGGGVRPDIVLYLILWEDDYEGNNCVVLQNHTAYKKCLTISPSPKQKHPQAYTYPLVLGPKGNTNDYEFVQHFHNKELEELGGGYLSRKIYSREKRKWASVHAEVLVVMGDQPARRQGHCLLGVTSLMHGRFGLLLSHRAMWDKVPSCDACSERLKAAVALSANCPDCVSWDAGHLGKRLCFKELAEKTIAIRKRIVSGEVMTSDAKKEMELLGVNAHGADFLATVAEKQRFAKQQSALGQLGKFPVFTKLMEDKPYLFDENHVLACWSVPSVTVSHIIEAVMHILFLGIVQDTLFMVHDWLACDKKKADYLRIMQSKIDGVQQLNISWCMAKKYGKTGKFGGKVSANYLADSRILLWMMLWITIAKPETRVDPDEDIPLGALTKPELETWLKNRGLPCKGTAPELRVLIQAYKDQEHGPPAWEDRHGGPEDNVVHMLQSLYALLPRLMSDHVTTAVIDDAERHIRIFLDAFERVDRAIREGSPPCQKEPGVPVTEFDINKSRTPQSASKGNHLCLMNLRDMMRNLGPLRSYWDGDTKAEASLKDSKKVQVGKGVEPEHVMKKELRLNAIRRIKWAQEKRGVQLGMPKRERTTNEYIAYGEKNFAKPWQNIDRLIPVSCVWYSNEETFWIQFNDKTEQQLALGELVTTLKGMAYFRFSLSQSVLPRERRASRVQENQEGGAVETVPEYCLLLPLPTVFMPAGQPPGCADDTYTHLFTVIGNNWTVLSDDRKLMRWYQIPDYLYPE